MSKVCETEFYKIHHTHYARFLGNKTSYKEGRSTLSATFVLGRVLLSPIDVPFAVTIDMLGYEVGAAANGNVRIGLYPLNTYGWPDLPDGASLIVETGSLAQPGGSRIHMATIANTALTPGTYYVGLQGDDVTGTYARSDTDIHDVVLGQVRPGRLFAQAYGAFPDPCPVTSGLDVVFVWMRVASIP